MRTFLPSKKWLCAAAASSFLAHANAQGQPAEEGLKLKFTGSIEAGALAHNVSSGAGNWRGKFVRAVVGTERTVWNAELLDLKQFGEQTQVLALAATHTLNPDWYASGAIAGSTRGLTQSRLRVDASLSRKWLDQRNLVTTVGLGAADARDGHRDYSVLLGTAFYFDAPWVVEGGVRYNRSNPGRIASSGKYLAITYGREKQNVFSVRYGFGSEAYQSVGSEALLSDFDSDVLTMTWRTWLQHDLALQTRGEVYRNPYYDRRGLELSLIKEF